jgi:hypothetical protein
LCLLSSDDDIAFIPGPVGPANAGDGTIDAVPKMAAMGTAIRSCGAPDAGVVDPPRSGAVRVLA